MLKLLGLDVVFAAAGNLYLLLALAGVCIALWKGKTWKLKVLFATLVLAIFFAPLAPEINRGIQYRDKLAVAQTMFAERCKSAGEKIYKTVDNVEGVFLMKLRPSEDNFEDQFKLDDPYGSDLGGDGYIGSFIKGQFAANHSGTPIAGSPPLPRGYSYVEMQDPKDGQRYRYTGSIKAVRKMDVNSPNVQASLKRDPNFDTNVYEFVLDKVPASGKSPRYGVNYDDISTHEEREYWIAGSSLKVVDLQTNEVIAERIGYMVDLGQGGRGGGRSPWLEAADNACPSFFTNPNHLPGPASAATPYQATKFVEKVLKPAK